jgi:TPR repeat protein
MTETEIRERARKGDPEAQCIIGRMYIDDNNYDEGIKWYRLAAEQGNDEAQRFMSDMFYYGGNGVERDFHEAAKWYRPIAERGDMNAQYTMGEMYEEGKGVLKDEKEAVKWYGSAADQGNVYAQKKIADMCVSGNGVSMDIPKAVRLYVLIICNSGGGAREAYHKLIGIDGNEEAAKWRITSTDQEDADSLFIMGMKHFYGLDVPLDPHKAVGLLKAAAESGNVYAQSRLGTIFQQGVHGHNPDYSHYDIITPDQTESLKWFKLAAEHGDRDSQFILGVMYHNGLGVCKDEKEATRLLGLAADQGHSWAKKALLHREILNL